MHFWGPFFFHFFMTILLEIIRKFLFRPQFLNSIFLNISKFYTILLFLFKSMYLFYYSLNCVFQYIKIYLRFSIMHLKKKALTCLYTFCLSSVGLFCFSVLWTLIKQWILDCKIQINFFFLVMNFLRGGPIEIEKVWENLTGLFRSLY